MSIWAAIKKAVNSNLDTPLDSLIGQRTDAANSSGSVHAKIKDVKATVGDPGDSANANGTVHAKLRNIKQDIANKSVVKSVQRGYFDKNIYHGSSEYELIPISPVNVDKSLIVLATMAYGDAAGRTGDRAAVSANFASSSTLKLVNMGNTEYSVGVEWQVIEFY
ncbi:hypothetical protein [Desulfofalx alkaliphila]|uniref:hypothetical protein n=1 Tax=Desulfofalx alkaliphila TaxID=105483 RepID=UPI0004E25B54|nr:hypothetical protein [Desulfofalx alkaliphila]